MTPDAGEANTPGELFGQGVAAGRWQDDPAQRRILGELDRIRRELDLADTRGFWQRLVSGFAPASVRGLYLWGPVGRGKTFLVDLLYQSVPTDRKLRLHFHRFMGRVHAGLAEAKGRRDPLRDVAAGFAARARLLCLDEFFVSDIGDAMILGGLLRHLFARGTTLVTTSNIPPAELYRDGLQRARFLPAIESLQRHCRTCRLESPQDYRLRRLNRSGVYFTPPDAAAEQALAACFADLAGGTRRPDTLIRIKERSIQIRARADGVIWFTFDALCDGPRAVADYIELAQSFNTVLISAVPRFTPLNENAARRFIELVDEFYDRGVKLVVSAAALPNKLYAGEKLRAAFARTESRLIEMQSDEYLKQGHRH